MDTAAVVVWSTLVFGFGFIAGVLLAANAADRRIKQATTWANLKVDWDSALVELLEEGV